MATALRVAYLGPPGTFTEAATLTLPEAGEATLDPRPSISDALDAVRTGAADRAVVPLESSIEGSVMLTLDELAFAAPALTIRAEVLLPITIALLARTTVALSDVRVVVSQPHAAAQCRGWLQAHLPTAEVRAASSTAEAARLVADSTEPMAALGAAVAAGEYGLSVLADAVGDHPDAVTRFVLVGPAAEPPPVATGADRTSAVAFIGDDHPGALLELLEEFAVRGVNLSRIESRPTKAGLGRYCFFVDCEGHVSEPRVGEALHGLKRRCADVRFLGSYPRGDDAAPGPLARGASESDFAAADAWLRDLRG